ncbi:MULTISPECIES: hypothetical protein [unclassified Thioalkalivibrio]|uniref:hypothetical protein n=1 Tax=unclassified Thioalkalivibrio TaxID=2621013 RepID=UPI0012DE80D6|nr:MULTISPECIES: hypothetical protein [unclassified Thioalkalivibrio]
MFTLDAWLERTHPSLRIVDSASRRVIAQWQGDDLHHLFESGTIAPEECCGPRSRESEHETIRELMLEACLEGLTVCRRNRPRISQCAASATSQCPLEQLATSEAPHQPDGRPRNLQLIGSTRSVPVRHKTHDVAQRPSLRLAFRKCPSPY